MQTWGHGVGSSSAAVRLHCADPRRVWGSWRAVRQLRFAVACLVDPFARAHSYSSRVSTAQIIARSVERFQVDENESGVNYLVLIRSR